MDEKTDIPGLYKTPEGGVINKDNEALKAYKMKKAESQRLAKTEEDLLSLKKDISDIKELLLKALNK